MCDYDAQLFIRVDNGEIELLTNSKFSVSDGSKNVGISSKSISGTNCFELYVAKETYVDINDNGRETYIGAIETHEDEVDFGIKINSIQIKATSSSPINMDDYSGFYLDGEFVDVIISSGGSTTNVPRIVEEEIIEEEITVTDIEVSNWDKLKGLFDRDDNKIVVRKWYNPFSWFGDKEVINDEVIETIDNSINDADELENGSNELLKVGFWSRIKSWFGG